MSSTYLYEVMLTGFDDVRVVELKSYVDSLNHRWGHDHLDRVFEDVVAGGTVLIYQTNDQQDVERIIGTLNIRGAQIELLTRD